jgi:hypothetical protein
MTHPTRVSLVLFAVALTGSAFATAQQESPTTTANGMASASPVSLGEHSKLNAQLTDRERIRAFYQGVLGCKLMVLSANLDSFQLGSTFNIGIIYDSAAPSAADVYKGIWLELETDHPEQLKEKILHFGIQGIDYFEKKHFYFQAPGGQVFRIVQTGEVL